MSIFDEIGLFEQGLEEGKVIRLTFQKWQLERQFGR